MRAARRRRRWRSAAVPPPARAVALEISAPIERPRHLTGEGEQPSGWRADRSFCGRRPPTRSATGAAAPRRPRIRAAAARRRGQRRVGSSGRPDETLDSRRPMKSELSDAELVRRASRALSGSRSPFDLDRSRRAGSTRPGLTGDPFAPRRAPRDARRRPAAVCGRGPRASRARGAASASPLARRSGRRFGGLSASSTRPRPSSASARIRARQASISPPVPIASR